MSERGHCNDDIEGCNGVYGTCRCICLGCMNASLEADEQIDEEDQQT